MPDRSVRENGDLAPGHSPPGPTYNSVYSLLMATRTLSITSPDNLLAGNMQLQNGANAVVEFASDGAREANMRVVENEGLPVASHGTNEFQAVMDNKLKAALHQGSGESGNKEREWLDVQCIRNKTSEGKRSGDGAGKAAGTGAANEATTGDAIRCGKVGNGAEQATNNVKFGEATIGARHATSVQKDATCCAEPVRSGSKHAAAASSSKQASSRVQQVLSAAKEAKGAAKGARKVAKRAREAVNRASEAAKWAAKHAEQATRAAAEQARTRKAANQTTTGVKPAIHNGSAKRAKQAAKQARAAAARARRAVYQAAYYAGQATRVAKQVTRGVNDPTSSQTYEQLTSRAKKAIKSSSLALRATGKSSGGGKQVT